MTRSWPPPWTRPRPPWTPTTRMSGRSAGTPMIDHWHELFLEEYPEMDQYLEEITYKFQKKIVKAWLLQGHRVDGRQKNEIRPLAAEVGVLPRVHGSASFTRGRPRSCPCAPLNTLSASQKLDTIWEEEENAICTTTTSPAYSVGEAKPPGPPTAGKGPRRPGGTGLDPVIPRGGVPLRHPGGLRGGFLQRLHLPGAPSAAPPWPSWTPACPSRPRWPASPAA